MSGQTHIDCFSTRLEDLKGAKARDPIVVYDAILDQGGTFSTFDVTDALAGTVTLLFREGYLIQADSEYPWVKSATTGKGIAWREGRLKWCGECSGKGYALERPNRRGGLAHKCAPCDGRGYHIETPTARPVPER